MNIVEKYTIYKRRDILKKSGIYIITNLINNKVYIGYTTCFFDRFRTHIKQLIHKKHINSHLQNAFNKYGIENFSFEILEEYPNEGFILPSMEHYWCNLFSSHNDEYGYNIKPTHPYKKGGNSPKSIAITAEKNRGRKQSKEAKKKISESNKGQKRNEEDLYIQRLRLREKFKNPILVFDNFSNFIGEFEYYRDFADKFNLNHRSVLYSLDNKLFMYNDYRITYKSNKIINLENNRIKMIGKFDENMNILKTYKNATDVAKQEKIDNSYISKSCREGGKMTSKGYFKLIKKVYIIDNELVYET